MQALNIQQQLKQVLIDAETHSIDLATLPAVRTHAKLTRFRSAQRVLAVVCMVAAVLGIPYWCMSYNDCHLNVPEAFGNAFRPPQDCGFCEEVTEVERVANIAPDEFERRYAYSGRPVIVTDATANWTAMEVSG